MQLRCLCVAMLALAACGQAGDRQTQAGAASNEARLTVPPPGTGPDAKTPFAPVKAAVDPKSVDAAQQVVERYGALIEQGRWVEARRLWTNSSTAAEFERRLRGDWSTHLEMGNPGDPEGAAGSIYVTVPAIFYNDMESGQPSRLETNIVLRRVNDVPGSTVAERSWRIERID